MVPQNSMPNGSTQPQHQHRAHQAWTGWRDGYFWSLICCWNGDDCYYTSNVFKCIVFDLSIILWKLHFTENTDNKIQQCSIEKLEDDQVWDHANASKNHRTWGGRNGTAMYFVLADMDPVQTPRLYHLSILWPRNIVSFRFSISVFRHQWCWHEANRKGIIQNT